MAPRRKPASMDSISEPADPNLTRYSLSDTHNSVLDNNNEVEDHLLQDYPAEQRLSHPDPFQAVASSVGRQSSDVSHYYSQPSSTIDYVPYQPGQHLAPIITGETLQLEQDATEHSTEATDPFYDPTTPVANFSTPLSGIPNEYHNRIQEHDPTRTGSYASYEHLSLQGGSEIDHFNHDTEAYASGNYSRAAYRPPRSRSPTPAVDDEDYMIVGNESVHYTGYPEAEPSSDLAMGNDKPYYTERGCLPNGNTVIFDPEPETPTSTIYSLPPDEKTQHFGPAPTGRILRRHKTKRRVHLTNGNFSGRLGRPS